MYHMHSEQGHYGGTCSHPNSSHTDSLFPPNWVVNTLTVTIWSTETCCTSTEEG